MRVTSRKKVAQNRKNLKMGPFRLENFLGSWNTEKALKGDPFVK